jgi:uncharacterized protein YabE (DUF348 family)
MSETKQVKLTVNGSEKGPVDTPATTVGEFVSAQAKQFGLRTFNVYLDGKKADKDAATIDLSTVKQVELIAKDARGL